MHFVSKCPRSYLLGYFFGDGSMKNVRGYYQACIYASPEDKTRVENNAEALGVKLNWRISVKGKTVEVATWPSKLKHLIGIDLLEGFNCYTRRLSMTPSWVDWVSFLEGFWDADGVVYAKPRKLGQGLNKKISIFIVNKELIKDINQIMVGMGFDPSLCFGKNGRGESTAQLVLVSKDYKKFRDTFKLQKKKQDKLDCICGLRTYESL